MVVTVGTVLYKITALIIGFAFAYLGYRLFRAGIYDGGGDLDATFSDTKLVLKKASPGIFFALFGTAVLVVTLTKGLELSDKRPGPPAIEITESDKIAIETIKTLLSGEEPLADILEFQKESTFTFLEKIEKYSELVSAQSGSGGATRGIASEEE